MHPFARLSVLSALFVLVACGTSSPPETSGDAAASADASARPGVLPGYEKCEHLKGCPVALCVCGAERIPYGSGRSDGTCNLDFADACKLYCPDPSKIVRPVECFLLAAADAGTPPLPRPTESGKTCDFASREACTYFCDCKNGGLASGANACRSDGTCPPDSETCPTACASQGGWKGP